MSLFTSACSNEDGSRDDAVGGRGSLPSDNGGGGNGGTNRPSTGFIRELTPAEFETLQASACNGWSIEPEGLPSKLELVVDISGSMENVANGGTETKWVVTREALREAVIGVNGSGLKENTAVGMLFYPGLALQTVPTTAQDSSSCLNVSGSVNMALLDDTQRAAIGAALDAVKTGRSTPTHDAYKYALDNVVLGTAQAAFEGSPYLLLITDGMPTLQFGCYNTAGSLDYATVPTQPIIDEIAKAYQQGVKTFLIGSPGSEVGRANGYDWLSAAARAGGTAAADCSDVGPNYCHMDMTTAPDFSSALATGLSQVTSTVSGCRYVIPTKSTDDTLDIDVNKITPVVTFSGGEVELIGIDETKACSGEGFKVNSTTELELCPATCARFQTDSKALLELLFGCSSIVAVPPTT